MMPKYGIIAHFKINSEVTRTGNIYNSDKNEKKIYHLTISWFYYLMIPGHFDFITLLKYFGRYP